MIDMTLKEEDKKDFIVDITVNEDGIKVTYANGFTEICKVASKHNLEFYRGKMEEQALKHVDKFVINCGIKGLLFLKTEMVPIILSVIGLFLSYNFDISILSKILITLLVLVINLFVLVFYEYNIFKYIKLTEEADAVRYYLDNKDNFLTTDENNEKSYCLNIEEIGQLHMNEKMVKDIEKSISEFKDTLGEDAVITLTKVRKDML
mgnify:CR=1 FL=1